MITLNLNGYTDVPSGKVANIATYLEMTEKPALAPRAMRDINLDPIVPTDLPRYRALFKAVGEDWLWFSRLALDDKEVSTLIQKPGTEIFAARQAEKDIGLLELYRHNETETELAYFGLVPEAVGLGFGHWLMNEAITRAFDIYKSTRLFVHTCTMDHPEALRFYQKSGFRPYKRAVEIADDPRLQGFVSKEKGLHHPIIG